MRGPSTHDRLSLCPADRENGFERSGVVELRWNACRQATDLESAAREFFRIENQRAVRFFCLTNCRLSDFLSDKSPHGLSAIGHFLERIPKVIGGRARTRTWDPLTKSQPRILEYQRGVRLESVRVCMLFVLGPTFFTLRKSDAFSDRPPADNSIFRAAVLPKAI